MMAFTWDWLLNNMISSGITDYYQLNVCINHCDFMLYRLGRDKGALLTEPTIVTGSPVTISIRLRIKAAAT